MLSLTKKKNTITKSKIDISKIIECIKECNVTNKQAAVIIRVNPENKK